jgi:ATP-dependent DNA helicase
MSFKNGKSSTCTVDALLTRVRTPSLPVVLYHGSKAERESLRNDITRAKKSDGARPKVPIIITSYNIAMNDKRFLQAFHVSYRA